MPPYQKALLFVVVAVVLTAATGMLLGRGGGIGRPREADRARHPAGFSIVRPHGWGVTLDGGGVGRGGERFISTGPDRYVGRRPSLLVRVGIAPFDSPRHPLSPGTFQGRPAEVFEGPEGRDWVWIARFERPEAPTGLRHAMLSLKLPVRDDVSDGPWRAFLETFRIEAPPAPSPSTLGEG